MKRLPWFLAGFVILLLGLSACSGGPAERLWLEAPGWSRAQLIGSTAIGDAVPIALDDSHQVYLFLIENRDDVSRPQVVALNRRAEIVWQRVLETPLERPDRPQIIWDGAVLHLFWLSHQSLYTARLDTSGKLAGRPELLSGTKTVDAYDVARDRNGVLSVWYGGPRREPGIYAFAPGQFEAEATLVDDQGIRPQIQFDDSGTLHAIWAFYPPGYGEDRFYYAAYPQGIPRQGMEHNVYEPGLSTGEILEGPWLGLDQAAAYLLWSISVRTGPEAGRIDAQYIDFPLGQPGTELRARNIVVPVVPELSYEALSGGGFAAGPRVQVDQYPGTTAVEDIAVNSSFESELALAFHTQIQHEFRKIKGQVGTLFLQAGHPHGYQLLSFTAMSSVAPAVTSDDTDQLYLTWLERRAEGGYLVYFASTAPDMVKSLQSLTAADMSRLSGELVFGMLSGAALAPLVVFVWLLLPLLVLALTGFIRRGNNDGLPRTGLVISLGLAIGAYWAVKLAMLPGILSYVPFSVWLPRIPAWMEAPLQLLLPATATLVAIRVAWHYTFRRASDSALYFIFIFAAVDGVITMAVYGFLFFNVI